MIAEDLACRELVELVTRYLEDALPPAERAHFEAHLGACRGCRAYLDQMRRTIGAVGRLAEESVPVPVMNELLRTFRGWKAAERS